MGLTRRIVTVLAAATALLAEPLRAGAPNDADFSAITSAATDEISAGNIPGAVILIGSRDKELYRGVFGHRTLGKMPVPMAADTIFDLASLTKVVATSTAIMQLAEAEKIDIAAPVSRYWPEFAQVGDAITIRDLLTHHSGLPAGIDLGEPWTGYETAMAMILAQRPHARPGTVYLYSDINFEILGEIVRRVSGQPFDRYCHDHIFAPLGMKDSAFRPPFALISRIAPTAGESGRVYWGEVHDATARRMGGVAGHAGLFSSADDLAIFARTLLNGGKAGGTVIMSSASVAKMTGRQSPPGSARARGLGWDLGGAGGLAAFPPGSFGHFGFTGTMLWVDPNADLFAVVLTHRVYPSGRGDADPLRRKILGILRQISMSERVLRNHNGNSHQPPQK